MTRGVGAGSLVYAIGAIASPTVFLLASTMRGGGGSAVAALCTTLPWLAALLFPRLRLGSNSEVIGLLIFVMGICGLVINPILALSGEVFFFTRSVFVPPTEALVSAVVLVAVAFVFVVLGYHLTRLPMVATRSEVGGRGLAVLFLATGLLGSVLRVGSLEGLRSYVAGDVTGLAFGQGSISGLLSTILPPFWTYGCLLIWRARPDAIVGFRRLCLILVAVAPMTLYSYNRAAIVIPLVCLLVVAIAVHRPWPRVFLLIGVVSLSAAALAVGAWRRIALGTAGGTISAEQAGLGKPGLTAVEIWQLYSAAPQFIASALSAMDSSGVGGTVASSVIGSIPYVGTSFRDGSGPAVFNAAIYGPGGNADQILPAIAELHHAFPVFGIPVAFLLLGVCLRRCQFYMSVSRDPLNKYISLYIAVWAASLFVFSISIVMQILVFFLWPAYAMVALAKLNANSCRDVLRTGS